MPVALPAVPLQKTVDDVLAVRVLAIFGHQRSNLGRFAGWLMLG